MMFAVVLNSNHYPHFRSWNKELWISISRTICCEWKLYLNHVHFILGNIRRCFYLFMLSNSLSLFCCVFEYDSLSLFQSQQYLWYICLFQLKGFPFQAMCFSGSYNQMSESDVEYYLDEKGHPLSLLNVDWKDMYQYHYYCHRYWSPIQLSNFVHFFSIQQ